MHLLHRRQHVHGRHSDKSHAIERGSADDYLADIYESVKYIHMY